MNGTGFNQLQRRARVYWVAEDEAWDVVRPRWDLPRYIRLSFAEGVPDDCVVERVFHSPMNRAFGFVLLHPSFDPVPDGGELPRFGHMLFETVTLRPGERPDCVHEAMREEIVALRAVFGDLLQDSPAARAIRDLALEDAARLVEAGGDEHSVDDAIAYGANAGMSAAIRRLKAGAAR